MFRFAFWLLFALCLTMAPRLAYAQPGDDEVRYQSGNIQVKRYLMFGTGEKPPVYHAIMRDQINFGECFEDPKLRRLPTTYHHPQGPLGMALQRFNWFPGEANTYHADARLPAALAALGCLASADAPLGQLVSLWSEPPIAVIGLEAGTVASYARPMQHMHFYEPTKDVIALHERDEKERFFHYIPDARQRGAHVSIIHGPPREKLTKEGPRKFYHLMVLEACSGENGEKIFLDLFTREGIAQCFESISDDGVLCVHTSHRYVDLPPVLAAIARDLKLHVRRGHDMAPGADRRGLVEEYRHFTSEWVMLARKRELLDAFCKTPKDYDELVKKMMPFRGAERYWDNPRPLETAWTDKGPNLLHGVLRGHPFAQRYSAVMRPVADAVSNRLPASLERKLRIRELGSLPRGFEEFMVAQQLKNNPQVEKLWP